jgi:hypothetical protein
LMAGCRIMHTVCGTRLDCVASVSNDKYYRS